MLAFRRPVRSHRVRSESCWVNFFDRHISDLIVQIFFEKQPHAFLSIERFERNFLDSVFLRDLAHRLHSAGLDAIIKSGLLTHRHRVLARQQQQTVNTRKLASLFEIDRM
jgi:hypothetical protein